jgi:hypothetical protein
MTQPRYAVRKIGWHENEYCGGGYSRLNPATETVGTFATREEADADARRREAVAREAANPFRFGGASLFYQSSLEAPQLHDWFLDAGIDPPPAPDDHADWIRWWVTSSPKWTAEQHAHAWAGLDRVRFFEVAEVSPTKAYVVMEINWSWHDEAWLDADPEGGNPVRAYRSRERAEAECARLNRERQEGGEHLGYSLFNANSRVTDTGGDWATSIRETVFFEVVEIDVGGES